jgi:CheY-like chemotaxis protein/anti-sigma regulatory factor (Ser/Thr protein kinase)
MLAFARRQDLKLEGVDVEALVKGVMGLLERSLGPTIRIETRFGPSLPPAHTDSNQLETALLNLAVNARDSMDAVGDVVIEATAHTVAAGADTRLPPGDYVRLSVTDSGPGMDAGTLERATEPFYTTKGVGKGTGLGLSMVHGLAEQSGGRLMISSRPGHGARVDIWLPRAERVSVDPQKEPASQGTPADARAIAVLVVDDDTLVLNNIAAMLEDLGHHTFTAASASEAMRLLERTSVDVVITDHAMPDMTGLELANRLKALRAELPVILATGFAELRPGEAGDLPRLAKPFTQDELAQALRDACPVPAPAPSDLTARTA